MHGARVAMLQVACGDTAQMIDDVVALVDLVERVTCPWAGTPSTALCSTTSSSTGRQACQADEFMCKLCALCGSKLTAGEAFGRGCVTALGDAAHPTTPAVGQVRAACPALLCGQRRAHWAVKVHATALVCKLT